MLSIGWLMFWKSIVIGIWIGIMAWWDTAKQRHAEKGVELRFDKKRGSYVARNPFLVVERYARAARNIIIVLGYLSVPVILWVFGVF